MPVTQLAWPWHVSSATLAMLASSIFTSRMASVRYSCTTRAMLTLMVGPPSCPDAVSSRDNVSAALSSAWPPTAYRRYSICNETCHFAWGCDKAAQCW